jgi:hypothetical protein
VVLKVSLPEHNFAAAKGRCFEKHNATFFFETPALLFTFFHDTQRVSGRYPQLQITRKGGEKKNYARVTMIIKQCLDFSFVFSAPLPA